MEKVRCVACDRGTSGAEASLDAVGRMASPDAMDWRSRRSGSCSAEAIFVGDRFKCVTLKIGHQNDKGLNVGCERWKRGLKMVSLGALDSTPTRLVHSKVVGCG